MSTWWGYFFLAAAFFLAGSSVVAARIVSGKLGVFTTAAASLFLALLVLAPLCRRQLRPAIQGLKTRGWISIILQALLGMFLFRMLLLQGLKYTSATEAGILTGVTPALTALLARLILKESLYPARLAGIVSTVAGVLLIQGGLIADMCIASGHIAGNMLVLGAALCESLFNVFSRWSSVQLRQSAELDPLVQTTLVTAMALLFCLPPCAGEQEILSLSALNLTDWLALLWYGLLVTALGYICWYAGIKRCESSTAAAFSGLMPLTALALSCLLLGEQPAGQQWLGGILVIIGMLVVGMQPLNPPKHMNWHGLVKSILR